MLKKKTTKKADKLRLKEENKTHLYHIGFYIYIQSDKFLDAHGNRKYHKLYDYADPNKVLILNQYQDADNDNLRIETRLAGETNVLKKYINNVIENQLYFYLNDQTSNVKNMTVINTMVDAIGETSEDFKRRIGKIRISHDIIGFKLTLIEIVRDIYNPPEIINIDVQAGGKKAKGINSRYTLYKVNLDATEFKDLLTMDYNEYIQKNFIPNSCFLTCCIETFYNYFEKRDKNGYRLRKELTYQNLANILEMDLKDDHNGIKVKDGIELFFKKYDFSLFIYDTFMNLKVHHPATNKANKSMRCIYKDGHLYLINNNLKSLQQIQNDDDEQKKLKVSDKYKVIQKDDSIITEVFCINMNDILQAMKKYSICEKTQQVKIITHVYLQDLLFYSMYETEYSPNVHFNCEISQLDFYINEKLFQVIASNKNTDEAENINFCNLKQYQNYNNAYESFYNKIIKSQYISEHHPSVIEFESHYKVKPCSGYFKRYSDRDYDALDCNKAYPNCLSKIKNVPVFSFWDVYKNYDSHPIEDLTLYKIQVLSKGEHIAIMFSDKHTIVYGYVLKELTENIELKYTIQYYRRPSTIEQVNYYNDVHELFHDKSLSMSECKNIANVNIGLLEKNKNKKEMCKTYKSYSEANEIALKYNTKVQTISKEKVEFYKKYDEEQKKEIDTHRIIGYDRLYIVKISNEKKLITNLMPIKNMVYWNMRLLLLSMYNKLSQIRTIYGIKTDCLLFNSGNHQDEKDIHKFFKINNDFGNYKLEKNKHLIDTKIKVNINTNVEIVDFSQINVKTFDDEYDTNTINEYITEVRHVLVKGNYPGTGKSTLALNFDSKCLMICPYNNLCQEFGKQNITAITFDKLFGLVLSTDDSQKFSVKKFDIDEYNTIVFDEVFLHTPKKLKMINNFIIDNPSKYIIATGDLDQRDSIGNTENLDINECLNILFKNQIVLDDIKRFKLESDKTKLKNLKVDIFGGMSIVDICDKYNIKTVDDMRDVDTMKNICYFNSRCETVNNHIFNNIIHKDDVKKPSKWIIGNEYVCREYAKTKTYKINKNYTYRLKKLYIQHKTATISNEVDKVDYVIPLEILHKNFKLPYANTCDSMQGVSLKENEKVTIFDANTCYIDTKYIWTACTRARKLENVQIFIHSEKETNHLTLCKKMQYLKFKCNNYKTQDTKAGREFKNIPENDYLFGFLTYKMNNETLKFKEYVNEDWLQFKIKDCKNKCNNCKKKFDMHINNGSVNSNLTVDRIDSSIAHFITNCQLLCHSCNSSKGNRY